MRKSCIQVMRKSRLSSLQHSNIQTIDNSFQLFHKTKFGKRLAINQLSRVATQKVLDKIGFEKQTFQPIKPLQSQQQIKSGKQLNIPEYQFLKNKQQLQNDPFLKAKMKYLMQKDKAQLVKQIPKIKLFTCWKKNTNNIENDSTHCTTLKHQTKKQNNKKLFLLTIANSKHHTAHQ